MPDRLSPPERCVVTGVGLGLAVAWAGVFWCLAAGDGWGDSLARPDPRPGVDNQELTRWLVRVAGALQVAAAVLAGLGVVTAALGVAGRVNALTRWALRGAGRRVPLGPGRRMPTWLGVTLLLAAMATTVLVRGCGR